MSLLIRIAAAASIPPASVASKQTIAVAQGAVVTFTTKR